MAGFKTRLLTWLGFQFQFWIIERPCLSIVSWLYIFILQGFSFSFCWWELSSHFFAEIFHFLVSFLTSSALTALLLFFKLNPITSIGFFCRFPSIELCATLFTLILILPICLCRSAPLLAKPFNFLDFCFCDTDSRS